MTTQSVMTTHSPLISRDLDTGWTLTAIEPDASRSMPDEVRVARIPATVPGSVHTDLLAAGLIPDPYLDNNEAALAWIGLSGWRYSHTFSWQPTDVERVELAFGGLDTVADIFLNGQLLGHTRNMHRSHRFDVTGLVSEGPNELVVDFGSAIRFADAASLELGYRPHVNHHPYNAIRKMACSFGWDWGIDTATAGLWKPVTLESWSTARLAVVRPVATVDGDTGAGSVAVHVELDRAGASDAAITVVASLASPSGELISTETVTMTSTEEEEEGSTGLVLTLRADDVALWWPRGYGEQPLYEVSVSISTDAGECDSATRRIGFRTVEFETTPDTSGTPFTVKINGQPVFIKGANWIPDDAFPHRVDRARYARRLDQAEFAGLNLIRVWGGGIYESDHFYELCDERGILTWQDFLLACAAYAEEEPLRSEIEAEAREAVTRLAHHPSLIIWNGNNENLWGYEEWNWKLRLDGKTWGGGYYYELFPAIVAELAPHIGYTPGSPFSPSPDMHPNDPDNGTMHIWDLWNQRDYPEYRSYTPRFVAEFGWQGPPTWSTLTASISDEPLTPESPGMLVHQKAMEGNVKLTDGLARHFPLPNNMEDWHWAMSLNQATAINTAIEYFRSLQPHTMGSIVWQLNDCWPVTSWSAVDGYERPKPLLYALRHAHAERLVTIQPGTPGVVAADDTGLDDTGLRAAVVNDSAEAWSGTLLAQRLHFDGTVIAEHSESVTIPPRGTANVRLLSSISTTTDAASELVRVEFAGARGLWFFSEYRDSALPAAEFATSLERHGDGTGYRLTVTAQTLARDVTLLVDKVDADAVVSDMLVTLLPGETAVFDIATSADLDLESLSAPRVLRSANQLVLGA